MKNEPRTLASLEEGRIVFVRFLLQELEKKKAKLRILLNYKLWRHEMVVVDKIADDM